MHPSRPGWKGCDFRYRVQVRKYLLLASHGVPINVQLPAGFPITGPESAMNWALDSSPGQPPNIVFFVAALLGV